MFNWFLGHIKSFWGSYIMLTPQNLECEVIQINAGSLSVYLPTKVHLQTTKDLFESSII